MSDAFVGDAAAFVGADLILVDDPFERGAIAQPVLKCFCGGGGATLHNDQTVLNHTMSRRPIDPNAVRIPQQSGLLPCLYIPIAARDIDAIEKYVGKILAELAKGSPSKALLVEAHEPDKPDERLAIWHLPEAAVLHYQRQVWVQVDYTAYRRAYVRAFPDVDLTGFVLDHIMNRRVARLKGFRYLRIVPISREANSSHGGLSEGWGVEFHSSPRMMELNKASQAVVHRVSMNVYPLSPAKYPNSGHSHCQPGSTRMDSE